MRPSPLPFRLLTAFFLLLLAALSGAQQLAPDSLTGVEGNAYAGGLSKLYAPNDDVYTRTTDLEPGTGNQVASYDVTFRVAADVPSAVLHADLSVYEGAGGYAPGGYLQAYLVGPGGVEGLGYQALATAANAVELPITGAQIAAYRNATTRRRARSRSACASSVRQEPAPPCSGTRTAWPS